MALAIGLLGNVALRRGLFSWVPWAASYALYPAFLSYGGWGGDARRRRPAEDRDDGAGRPARHRRARPAGPAGAGRGQRGRLRTSRCGSRCRTGAPRLLWTHHRTCYVLLAGRRPGGRTGTGRSGAIAAHVGPVRDGRPSTGRAATATLCRTRRSGVAARRPPTTCEGLNDASPRLALALDRRLLAVPALTVCGLNYATDRPYTPAAGVNDQDARRRRAGRGDRRHRGRLRHVHRDVRQQRPDQSARSRRSPAPAGARSRPTTFEPSRSRRVALVNLADDGGIPVTGDFERRRLRAGHPPASATASRSTMEVPVVANCGDYEGLDGTSSPSPREPSDEAPPSRRRLPSE